MADPQKKLKETPEVAAPPVTAAETEAQVLAASKAMNFQSARNGNPTAVLPGGRRIDATPYVKARYNQTQQATFLGDPESIVKESFKREHPGWKYAWPNAKGMRTEAYIRSTRYKKVPFDAIDVENHRAMVTRSPEGDTVWMQHVLVAMHPSVFDEEYNGPVEEAIGRTAMNRRQAEAELNEHFGRAGYKGEFSISDHRQER